MQRKLVKMGSHSLMSVIPSNWCKKNNLEQGDFIQYFELDNKLIITSDKEEYVKKAEITISSDNIAITWRNLYPFYTSGYDEIKVYYNNKKTFKLIESHLQSLIGFEIVETTEKFILIKSVTKQLESDIKPLLKRVWFIIKQSGYLLEEIFDKKDKSRFEEIKALELTINKYMMLLRRIINRTGYKYSHYMYVLINSLELAPNHFEYIRRYYADNNKQIKSDYALNSKKLNKLISQVYDLQYNYNIEKFNKISLALPHFNMFKSMADDEIKYHFISIAEYLMQVARQIYAMNL